MQAEKSVSYMARVQRYLLAGVLTAIPIWITWLVFDFFLSQLSQIGRPWVIVLARALRPGWPGAAEWLLDTRFQSVLGVLIVLLSLYLLGWLATQVLGRRLLGFMDALIDRIPMVKKVYGSVKQLMAVIEQKPDGVHRVVLIDFPQPEMKAVAFVMKTFREEISGREMAAVYVPTTPNPTSGYLEIVPLERLVETQWSMDEAMSFIVSGGAVSPKHFRFTRPAQSTGSEAADADL